MPIPLETPIEKIRKISPAYNRRLIRLGVKTLRDLFFHFPNRYEDFSKIRHIGELKINEIVTVQGEIAAIENIRTWKKRMVITEAYVKDATGIIRAVWFNQPFLAETLKKGDRVSLSGKVSFDKDIYFSNPVHEKLAMGGKNAVRQLRHTGRLVPVYPETAGLSSRYLRYIIGMFADSALQIKDWLPQEIKKSQNLIDLNKAVYQIHFPSSPKAILQAKRRLAFDEIFLIQLFAAQQRSEWKAERSREIHFNQTLIKDFLAGLPFSLTDAQRKAAWEIFQDMEKTEPMNRLLEGDVGSGKTIVAAMAAMAAANEGMQAALMAPTEILAQQHFRNFCALFKSYPFKIALATSKENKIFQNEGLEEVSKKDLLKEIKNGRIDIAMGTHSLITEKIAFKNLALAIVDEQHRFGVEQRAALQKNIARIDDGQERTIPHLLSMTATPIPRTLALTIFGDLDVSLLDQMPKGRVRIITKIVAPRDRQQTYEFIRQEIKNGRQAFVVCPRIESDPDTEISQLTADDKKLEIKTVTEEYRKLSSQIFPELKIEMLHGRLKAAEKEKIMSNFKDGRTDILISTSVIEVGIDVPNATVMMIEGADRFGLAQLHQFRGRIGRGEHQSYCFLLTDSFSLKTRQRLKAMLAAKNGFELAQLDLELRGPGQFYGTRQWGLPDLSMASLNDLLLIKACQYEAAKLLQNDPKLKKYPSIADRIKEFKLTIHLE